MRRLLLSFAVGAICTAAAAATVEFAYTAFETGKCRHHRGRDVEDYGTWTCPGHAGIQVYMSAGDQRVSISFGPDAERELAARQTLSAINGVGGRIEWRIARDERGRAKPFAAIMRWSTAVVGDDPAAAAKDGIYRGQVLVVTRLGPGGVCHVGYVDGRANADANELARDIADTKARTFRCGSDHPVISGKTGPGFSEPMPIDKAD